MVCNCCCLQRDYTHDNDEIRPLLANEEKSYEHRSNIPAPGEYKSPREQKLAIAGLLINQFFRVIAFQIVVKWIPNFATLSLQEGSIADTRMGTVAWLSLVIRECGAPVMGILSDALMKKTTMLLIGTALMIVGYGYVCSITFGIAHCVQLNGTAISSDFGNSSIPFASLSMTCITDESALNYLITASAVVSLSESIFRAIVPAVSGDQFSNINGVRMLYILYYWVWKFGDFCALLLTLYISDLTEISSPKVISYAGIVTIMCVVVGTISMVTVIACKWTRQINPNVGVIVDTALIWREACLRRRKGCNHASCIHMAGYSQGGSFPDMAVVERKRLGLFYVTLLCLLPVSFMTVLPTFESINHNGTQWISTDNVPINGIHAQFFSELSEQLARIVTIPAVFFISHLLRERARFTIFHRLVCGYICMFLSSACSLVIQVVPGSTETNFYTAMVTAGAFVGMCNSLIYTAVFELALLTAPRSMQSTAMGMLASIDGFTYIIFLMFFYIGYHPSVAQTPVLYEWGMGIMVVTMFILIFVEKKLDLGLRKN